MTLAQTVKRGNTQQLVGRRLRPRVVIARRIRIPVLGAWMQRIALAGKATPS